MLLKSVSQACQNITCLFSLCLSMFKDNWTGLVETLHVWVGAWEGQMQIQQPLSVHQQRKGGVGLGIKILRLMNLGFHGKCIWELLSERNDLFEKRKE